MTQKRATNELIRVFRKQYNCYFGLRAKGQNPELIIVQYVVTPYYGKHCYVPFEWNGYTIRIEPTFPIGSIINEKPK